MGGSGEDGLDGLDGLADEGGSVFSVLLLGRMRDRRAAGRPMVSVNQVDAGRLRG